jgi:hypothetical protein
VEGSLAVAPNMVTPMECRELRENRSTVDEIRLGPDSVCSLLKDPADEGGVRRLVKDSPWEASLSSERLDGLREAESRLSLAGLEEGGGMLMLGLSMVVFVCSVPACRPFLRVEEALVADRRVCELDLFDTRVGIATFADPELEVEEMILVSFVSSSSSSGISSGTCWSPVFSRKFSAIPWMCVHTRISKPSLSADNQLQS